MFAETPTTLREKSPVLFEDIVAEKYRGMTVLKAVHCTPRRRVLYLNSYGMASIWPSIREGTHPGHHLWGCLELARMGYEIAMPEEPDRRSRFFNYRRQDLRHLPFLHSWLGADGIVYSGHTILFWIPLLVSARLIRSPVVSMLYARGENLRFANGYRGLLALTPAAEKRVRNLAPHAEVAHVSWGADLSFFPALDYDPQWFLVCGKTRRDFSTLAAAAENVSAPVRIINTERPAGIAWPSNVSIFSGGRGDDWQTVSFHALIHEHYAGCIAALIILEEDDAQRYGAGFTQMLEAMSLAKPVIVTRTGALADELDIEKEGCGIFVPPNDRAALAAAMRMLAGDPALAEAMGKAGRMLCETRYNILRYADELHKFFERL